MKTMSVLYHLLAFILLVAAAALQLNDPDPVWWGGFYGFCALIPLLAVFGINVRILYVLCLLYGIGVLVPTIHGFFEYLKLAGTESLLQQMAPDKLYLEEAREFLGTLIAIGLITGSMIGQKRNAAPD